MNKQASRFAENALFSLLIAALIGWSAATVAADVAAPAVTSVSCAVATASQTLISRMSGSKVGA
jgi:hypothetical protein